MNKLVIVLCAALGVGMCLVSFPNGALSALMAAALAFIVVYAIKKYLPHDEAFLVNLFLIALILRIVLGFVIHIYELRGVFGPDAYLYDTVGERLMEIWWGQEATNDYLTRRASSLSGPGWGMFYLVAAIYSIFGSSKLIAQTFCACIGAATVPMVYKCAETIFNNRKVSTYSAIAIAVFPSFIVWSSQLLKDGLLIFLLVVSMTFVLELQKKFSYSTLAILLLSLFAILSLRFYVFYMVIIAVVGSFFVGLSGSRISLARNFILLVLIGAALSYFAGAGNFNSDIGQITDLERVQLARQALAKGANSGFGEDIDVSTSAGAVSAIPIGLSYLMLAPFPWQINNIQQLATLPEVIVWWCLLPIMISGLVYVVKHKLRSSIPILLFSAMLTVAYSIFQGNVGMAYRQRTQIQVFLFMFIAVGFALIKEKKENKKLLRTIGR